MSKAFFLLTFLVICTSCSSTMSEMNRASSEVAADASMIEHSADSIDRAIATGERIGRNKR